MWVVKIGGSLGRDASEDWLPGWLDELASLGGGRIVIVPGGGSFSDQVREAQTQWHFSDLVAHNMAVLAMAQTAMMLQGMRHDLVLAITEADIHRALHQAKVPIWVPFEVLRQEDGDLTHWGVTSDSLAAWLSKRLNAERLLLVKSCAINPGLSVEECIAAGIVDESFGDFMRDASYPVELIDKRNVSRMRELLLSGVTA
jgi:aspartokinase-like uncharacterized kinase